MDWKKKLSSRKFWAAVVGFVTAMLVAFNVPDIKIEQVSLIITAAGTLIAYIISEGIVDSSRGDVDGNDSAD